MAIDFLAPEWVEHRHLGNTSAIVSDSYQEWARLTEQMRDYEEQINALVSRAYELLKGDVQLGDVREKNEWDEGHLPGAAFVPKSYLEQWAEDRLPSKDKPTILYCAGGVRSVMAADALQKLGYTNVVSMSGGFTRWKDAGLPWTKPETLAPEQAQRYARHLRIPEIGECSTPQELMEYLKRAGFSSIQSKPGDELIAVWGQKK